MANPVAKSQTGCCWRLRREIILRRSPKAKLLLPVPTGILCVPTGILPAPADLLPNAHGLLPNAHGNRLLLPRRSHRKIPRQRACGRRGRILLHLRPIVRRRSPVPRHSPPVRALTRPRAMQPDRGETRLRGSGQPTEKAGPGLRAETGPVTRFGTTPDRHGSQAGKLTYLRPLRRKGGRAKGTRTFSAATPPAGTLSNVTPLPTDISLDKPDLHDASQAEKPDLRFKGWPRPAIRRRSALRGRGSCAAVKPVLAVRQWLYRRSPDRQ